VAAISLDDAVATALSKDPGVISANLDYLSASSKADSAKWKQLPSLSASGGYTRLSELPSSDTSFNTSITLNGKSMPLSMSLPSILDMVSFGLNLQYPVFTGFRVKESIAIAKLTAQAKDVTRETVKRSLVFDVTRAYWEAVRATYNVATLQKNLELQKKNSDLATRQLGQGVATRADQLAAQMRLEQATEDLDDAQAMERRAYLSLASLTGMDLPSLGISTAALETALPFVLSTKPEDAALEDATKLDEASLVSGALEKRPETRTAELARKLALHAVELSRAALYPTVAITGNFTDADPNQRVAFQTSSFFTPTWALGIQLSYDIGGVPAALDDIKAQALAATKAKSDEDRQREAIVMDVEGCILNLERAARDLASTQSMVGQATENLRVMQGRVAAGSAKDLDLSSTQFDLLRTNFAVTNKLVDLIVAQADLDRATAARDVK
jgi:outer membrane protein TolC